MPLTRDDARDRELFGDLASGRREALGPLELAVALRRFRLGHGQYPEALSALVPVYLPRMPLDPFTGKPPV